MWIKSIQVEEQFYLQMDDNLPRPEEHGTKLLDELNESHQLEIKNKPAHWLVGHLLPFLGRFCRINWNGNEQVAFKCGRKQSMPTGTKRQRPWRLLSWPNAILGLYFLSSAFLLVGLYYHYLHDQFVFHLRRFRKAHEMRQMIVVMDYANNNVTEQKIRSRLEQTRTEAQRFGAPFLEATYATECSYLFVLMAAYISYLNTSLYSHFTRKVDFYIVRLILNRTFERRNFNRLIGEQVNNYIQSCCNFTEAFVTRCIQLNGLESFKLEQLNQRCELKRLLLDYKRTILMLKQMSLEGSLQPMNRSNKWIDKLTVRYCFVCLFLLAIPFTFYLLGFILIPRKFQLAIQLGPMDVLAAGALSHLWLVLSVSACFYVSVTIINGIDQANLIEHLTREIKATIGENRRAFIGLLGSGEFVPLDNKNNDDNQLKEDQPVTGGDGLHRLVVASDQVSGLLKQMNNNLLFVVVHYKIFVAQLRAIQRSFGFICMTALVVIFLTPLIGRLHMAYVSPGVKVFIVAMSLATLIIGNVCIAPVCHLHHKCLKLYKALWALLAHAVDVASNSNWRPSSGRIYDKHTIWMLRKELNHPDRLASQFATKSFGLSFTYPNLIRINFWFGLLVLSILSTDIHTGDQEELMGSLSSDPLGIFSLDMRHS